MTKKEHIMDVLEKMDLNPRYDEDGDIMLKYQLKNIFFITNEDEVPYVYVLLPKFYQFKEENTTLHLAACNKLSRELKLAKVFVDKSLSDISASCEFFYTDEDTLKLNVTKALQILKVIRSSYQDCLNELIE